MTDNEIVKALECCGKLHIENIDSFCNECIFKGKAMCIGYLCDNSIDLINRLQEENERLKNILICFMDALGKVRKVDDIDEISLIPLMSELNKQYRAELKAEAYKEFADELKCRTHEISYNTMQVVNKDDINNLLKELVGENND